MKKKGGDPNREEYKFTGTNPNAKYFKAGAELSHLSYSRYTQQDYIERQTLMVSLNLG